MVGVHLYEINAILSSCKFHASIVELLLEAHCKAPSKSCIGIDKQDFYGKTALSIAVKNGDIEVARKLLKVCTE